MPKETFFNLPKEKQERLLSAIKNELARVPFSKFSVNKIIKEAGISRGSFYQYFYDRNDMLEYILIEFRKNMIDKLVKRLEENNGDIFDMFYYMFEVSIEISKKHDYGALYRNMMSDLSMNAEFYLRISDKQESYDDDIRILPYIEESKFGRNNKDSLLDIIHIIKTISLTALAEVFTNSERQTQIKADYKRRLNLIKNAFERKECQGE